jgi:hypothetical protein
MAAGCPDNGCGEVACNFWHAPLGSLQSGLVRAQGTHRLMENEEEALSFLLRRVSHFLNQPIYELGTQHAAQLVALMDQNKRFELSAGRAMYSQMLINEREADRDAAFVKRRRIVQATKYTVEQLQDILSDESKILGLPDVSVPRALGVPATTLEYSRRW